MIAFFVLIWKLHVTLYVYRGIIKPVLGLLGFSDDGQDFFGGAFDRAMAR